MDCKDKPFIKKLNELTSFFQKGYSGRISVLKFTVMVTINVEEERKEILRRYRRLLRKARPSLKGDDAKMIKKAFNLSLEAHSAQRRKSGEPYIYHPLAVAQICVEEIGLGTTSIIAALLHDVVEDTEIELDEIKSDFGPKISRIIDGLTKIAGVPNQGTSKQAENFRKILLTLSDDVRVILVKLADRLHNMRTMGSMPQHTRLKIISETIHLYAPLAHRLGLHAIKSELEDLWLKYSETKIYDEITSKIAESKSSRSQFIRKFVAPIREELNSKGLNFEIKGRLKSIHSIWNKTEKQHISFEEIYDHFAIRIILDNDYKTEKGTDFKKEKKDCWEVYSTVTDLYVPNPGRLRDWISNPRANGYESLHTTVMSRSGKWVEVQIRTRRMDEIAEKGYAAHWKYKEGSGDSNDSGLEQWMGKVRETLEQNDANAIEFVDDFRTNFFSKEVFVFTPKGESRILPSGATVLDFAFDIHTRLGAKCTGAKVNKKLVPLDYRLKNGDQVEIFTSKNQRPKEDWLRFVVTSKARSKIKDTLKEAQKQAATEGKEIVRRKLKQMKTPFNGEVVNQLKAFFGEKTVTDLYYKIAKGIINPSEIKHYKDTENGSAYFQGARQKREYFTDDDMTKVKMTGKDTLLMGDDMDVLDYQLAPCCKPIPGDDVFGYVTVNEGIKVHRTNCPNAHELLSNHGDRVIKARWMSGRENASLVELKIGGIDRLGLIKDVTDVISSELKVNMRSMSIGTKTEIFNGQIRLYISNTDHLEELKQKLKKVEGVVEVSSFRVAAE